MLVFVGVLVLEAVGVAVSVLDGLVVGVRVAVVVMEAELPVVVISGNSAGFPNRVHAPRTIQMITSNVVFFFIPLSFRTFE